MILGPVEAGAAEKVSQAVLQVFQLVRVIPTCQCIHYFIPGGRVAFCQGVVSLGLAPILPRAAGQVRAVVRFKPDFLGQTQASAMTQTRAMITKTFIVLSSFVRGFGFLCCAALRGFNGLLRFRGSRFGNCRAALAFEPGQVVSLEKRRTATSR
jgi:hypothetical protein